MGAATSSKKTESFRTRVHYHGMKMLIVLLWASTAFCQGPVIFDPLNPVVDGMIQGTRLRLEAERILNERRRIQLEEKAAEREYERMRLEDQRLRQAAPVLDGIDEAIAAAAAKFADFYNYREEMARVSVLMTPKAGHMVEYVEAVYLVAKFASFSRSPDRRSPAECARPVAPPATLPADFTGWDMWKSEPKPVRP